MAAGPGRTRRLSATAARDRRVQAMGRTRPTARTLTQTDACVTYDVTRDRLWKACGGYGSQGENQARENSAKERIWFSPHCISGKQGSLFA